MTYENTSENPSTTLRTLSFQVSDGALSSNVATRDIALTAVNDAPVLSGLEGTTLSYTENAAPTAVTSTLVVSDVDNANMVSATVSFTAGFATGQDLLSATTSATNITANYNGATGVLTLSGSDTKANYQSVLRSVTYENTSENPSTTLRTLSFQVSDGALSSNVATRDIALTAVNDAPVLSGLEGTTLSYTENAAPTAVTSTLVVSDVDNANMVSASVSFTAGFATGQDLLSATTSATNITANYNGATGVLTLSGSDTKANYQSVLRSVTYENTSENPSTTLRTLSFQVSDGALSSNVATRDIALTAVNDAPVLSGLEGTTLSYTENAAPTAVTSTLVVSDVDNANMVSATVSFTAGFATGQDLLSATTSATNITANYNSATGVLTLSGSDTKANYQSVLRSVTYENTSENPSTTLRTLSFQVSDGALSSNVATRDVSITAVDDAAVVIVSSNTVNISDPDGDTASNLLFSIVNGKLRVSSLSTPTVGAGSGTTAINSQIVEVNTAATSLTAATFALGNLTDQLSISGNVTVPVRASATADLEKVVVPGGATLTVSGILKAAIEGQSGSTVTTSGSAEIGDGSFAGFSSVGSLQVNSSHTLILRDSTGIVFPVDTTVSSGGILFVKDNNEVHQTSTAPSGSTLRGNGAANVSTLLNGGMITSDLFFNATVTTTSGILSPGSSSAPGRIWMNNLNLNGGTLEIGIAGSAGMGVAGGNDVIRVDNSVLDGQQGHVALSGADLSIVAIGTPTINPGDRYVILNNYGNDAIIGTLGHFASYDEGAVYSTNFLGSGLTARITYHGGDGNDVAVVVEGAANIVAPTTDSIADTTTIVINGGNLEIKRGGTILDSRPNAGVTSIVLNGSGDDDNFVLDFANGNPLPAGGIFVNGNGQSATGPGDALELKQGSVSLVTHVMTNANDGSISVDGSSITYTGLEPIIDNLSATDRVFTFSGNDDNIMLTTGTTLHNMIDSNFAESVEFNNPTNSLTINAGDGNDSITISSIHSGFGAALTINGGIGNDTVALNADLNLASGKSLDVDLQNDAASPGIDTITIGSNANLAMTGAGNATLKASRNIALASGSSIQTVNGSLTLEANQQTTATAGNFVGVDLSAALVEVTGTGALSIKGRGGNDNSGNQYGVWAQLGADIVGGTAGSSTSIEGVGGDSAGQFNFGTYLTGAIASLTSHGGDVTVDGVGGGTAASSQNRGVYLSSTGSTQVTFISAGGTGAVRVTGTGGMGAGSQGVVVQGFAQIRSDGGSVNIIGYGGTGAGTQYGVFLQSSATITAGGTGNLDVTGYGGNGNGSLNAGVVVQQSSTITSSGGHVSVTGTAGNTVSLATAAIGVELNDHSTITAGGTGGVIVTGYGGRTSTANDGVRLEDNGNSITSSGGTIQINGIAGGFDGTFGGTTLSSDNVGVRVLASSSIHANGSGSVEIEGTGGLSSDDHNIGVMIAGASAVVSSNDGSVSVVGFGGGTNSSALNYGVLIDFGGMVNAGGTGDVTIDGSGGNADGSDNAGVWISGVDSLVTALNGDIAISGLGGGAGTNSTGVTISEGAHVIALAQGSTDITGSSAEGPGEELYGVELIDGAVVSAVDGSISIHGIGRGDGSSESQAGIYIWESVQVTATGTGTVDLFGQGGFHGVQITGDSVDVSTNSGTLALVGIASQSPSQSILIAADTENAVFTNGSLILEADEIEISSVIQSAGSMTLRPHHVTIPINLGNEAAGQLSLTQGELDLIVADNLIIGSSGITSEIVFTDSITALDFNSLTLITQGPVTRESNQIVSVEAITITSSSIGTALNPLAVATSQLTTTTSGDQVLQESGELIRINLNAGAGTITLSSDGAIGDDDPDLDIQASIFTLTAGGSVGSSTALTGSIATSVDELEIDTAAANGSLYIVETNALSKLQLTAGTGSVQLNVGGSLTDSDAAIDVQAQSLALTTNGSVGSNVNPLRLNVSNLSSTSSTSSSQYLTTSSTVNILPSGLSAPSGSIYLLGGIWSIGGNEQIGNSTAVELASVTTLRLNNFNESLGGLRGSGSVELGTGNLTTTATQPTSFDGVISGAGTVTVAGSEWTLNSVQTYSGGTSVSGALRLMVENAIQGSVTVSSTGYFHNAAPVTLTALNGSGFLMVESVLTIDTSNGSSTFSGSVDGTSSGSIVKTGTNRLTFDTTPNLFDGDVFVNAGELYLKGLESADTVTVAGGATLLGRGPTGAVVVQSGGVLSPGASPGKLTVSSLTLSAGSTLNIELEGTTQGVTYDWIEVTGLAVLDGTLNVTGSYVPQREDNFRFLTYASRSGNFATLNLPSYNARTLVDPSIGTSFYDLKGKYIFVTNTNNSGTGSLRDAITRANSASGADTILFNIAGSGVQTIAPGTALPTLTGSTIVDGTSQTGYTSTPLIELTGTSTPASTGLVLTGSSTVKGLTINSFTYGVELQGTNNLVVANYIGTDAAGSAAAGNSSAGVRISFGSGNIIGGSAASDRNIISGNYYGVDVRDSSNNQILGNTIGLNQAGNAAVANTRDGILIGSSPSNVIEGNVISGNANSGILISASLSVNNVVRGNLIGTDVSGTIDLGNTVDGINILNASNNTIGGTLASQRNVISGNNDDGITLGGASSGNVILGNLIGLNLVGNAAVPNSDDGISTSAGNNIFGGSQVGAGNYISGNLGDGIELISVGSPRADGNQVLGNIIGRDLANNLRGNGRNGINIDDAANNVIASGNMIVGNTLSGIQIVASTSTGNVIKGNLIGTDGTSDLGNLVDGINISNSPNNTIGGLLAGDRNVISGNSDDGITFGTTANSNLVLGNYIGTNLAGTSAIPNGDDGIVITSSSNIIGGSASGAGNLLSGNGGDGLEISVVTTTPASNQIQGNTIGLNASGTAKLANSGYGIRLVGAVNTNIGGNVTGAGNTISGNTLSGIQVSASTGTIITGNVIGLGTDGSTVLGNSQSGIEVSGGSTDTRIGSDADGNNDSAERNVISGNSQNGVFVSGTTTATVTVAGNYVGTDISGTFDRGNTLDGVAISSSSGHLIGGTLAAARNVVSGNDDEGVSIIGSSSSNIVSGNYLGTNATGDSAIGNTNSAVRISNGATSNTIGGATEGARNVISGGISSNNGRGVLINGTGTSQNIVSGNYIGLNAAGTAAIAHTNSGVLINQGATNNTIGGATAASRNVISGNTLAGVAIGNTTSTGNVIQNNWIGINAAGTAAIPNLEAGIGFIDNSSGNSAIDNVVSGNAKMGIGFLKFGTTVGSSNNIVRGNKIGTNPAGTAAIPNTGYGINLVNGSSGNTIGGTTAADRNIVSGNTLDGIRLSDSGTTNNIILGNYVGVASDGTTALANQSSGVRIEGGASSNRIGTNGDGTGDANERNIISGNLVDGISVQDTGTANNVIAGNWIGLNAAGSAAIPNLLAGVAIFTNASGTRVGTDGSSDAFNSSEGNVIAGNGLHGIYMAGSPTGSIIAGNTIGLGPDGSTAIGNGWYGIALQSGTSSTRVGTDGNGIADAAERNVISSNGRDGILVVDVGTDHNSIAGNYIGTDATGLLNRGNSFGGIAIANGATNTRVGTDGSADANDISERNVISGNNFNGVFVGGANTSGVTIAGNFIGLAASGDSAMGNNGDGIQVHEASSITVGTNGDGVSDSIEGNVIGGNGLSGWSGVAFSLGAHDSSIAGNLIGTDGTGNVARPNGTGIWIATGANTIRIGTNGDGVSDAAERNLVSGNQYSGIVITEAVTNNVTIAGNVVGLNLAGTDSLGNSDHGLAFNGGSNLRIGTNGDGTNDITERNIISGNGKQGIYLTGTLSGTIIAGNYIGTDVSGLLDRGNTWSGIAIDSAVTNTRIGTDGSNDAFNANERNVISGNQLYGIYAAGQSTTGTVIAGNFVGITSAGIAAIGNSLDGIYLSNTLNTRIGTNADGVADSAERNIVSGNVFAGIVLADGAIGTRIVGNYAGLNAAGTAALGNGTAGILISTSSATIVGTNGDGVGDSVEGNVSSGNGWDGVRIVDTGNTGTIVAGNYLGTDATGVSSIRNGFAGVAVHAGVADVRIGTNADGVSDTLERNILAGNQNEGVWIRGTNNVTVAGNFIGLNVNGTALANGQAGVDINGAAINSLIGTNSDGVRDDVERNIISSSGTVGVFVRDSGTANNRIVGNYIGTDATGSTAMGNTDDSIRVTSSAAGTQITNNVIAASTAGDGIEVSSAGSGTTIRGNLIGLAANGTTALGNLRASLYVLNTSGVTVGGPNLSDRNIVSAGQIFNGVQFSGSSNGIIQNNYIGTDQTGSVSRPNRGEAGVLIDSGSSSVQVLGNVISGNSGSGLIVRGSGTNNTIVTGNIIGLAANGSSVLSNAKSGIDVNTGAANTRIGTNGDGVNDTAERNLISSNTNDGIWIKDSGTSGTIVAGNYIGTDSTGLLDRGNAWSGITIHDGATGTIIGTDGSNDSFNVNERNVISGNDGYGIYTQGSAASYSIAGNYIGVAANGTQTLGNSFDGIFVNAVLSAVIGTNGDGIADLFEGNVISGNLQNGIELSGASGTARIMGNKIGTNAAGSAAIANAGSGIYTATSGTFIGTNSDGVSDAFEVNVISGNSNSGITVTGSTTSGVVIAGNYVGTNPTGTTAIPNVLHGVLVTSGAQSTRIGTNADGFNDVFERNVIAGNTQQGIYVSGAHNSVIAGNYIGVNGTGSAAIGNHAYGIRVDGGSTGTRIGTDGNGTNDVAERNIIGGSTFDGIRLAGSATSGNDRRRQLHRSGSRRSNRDSKHLGYRHQWKR